MTWSPDKEWAFGLYELLARGGDLERLCYYEIDGNPWSKSRPRFARRGGTYQPRDDREAEQRLAWQLRAGGRHSVFAGNVMLACRFYRANAQRIDTDNLIKHVCDSANGILWKDDSQVTLVIGETQHDPAHPRTIILAGNHESSLRRGDDRLVACLHCGADFLPLPGLRSHRFCTQACAYAARITGLVPKACEQCQRAFQPKTKMQILCSRKCAIERMRGRNQLSSSKYPLSCCAECGKQLAHRRGGRCRDCWRANPRFYAEAQRP